MNYILDSPDNQRIREGDKCVIHISEHIRYILNIAPEAELQTKFGLIKASDLINHPYGIRYECKKGWVLPLRLTPEFWTQLLPHRTQILYQADISMILLQLDVKPGSIVVESGTGSGSLSHAILRACLPNGFLHTYDINESRVKEAQKEFIEHGFGNNVRVVNRNICEFGYNDDLVGNVDACILDLPQTWSAIEHANKVLKADGSRLCTFSPCIEQVQQNVAKMVELNFKDIVTMECLSRPYDVRERELRLWNDDILQRLAEHDQKTLDNLENNLNNTKRAKIDDAPLDDKSFLSPTDEEMKINSNQDNDSPQQLSNKTIQDSKAHFTPHMLPTKKHLHAQQYKETVSHSGFLTFASKRA